ncbi:MAG TPA: M23 family metallopeptidase [Usitatibacter sp.]|nr:M23 family metallopeptidase [Usitatibacter sp.]
MSPDKQAGLVLAVSTLLVVTSATLLDMFRAPRTLTAPSILEAVRTQPVEAPAPVAVRPQIVDPIVEKRLLYPVQGANPAALRDTFEDARGRRRHQALDIMAPRGTPVMAVDDGHVAKLFRSAGGGISVYQYDAGRERIYYYAHLDRYAPGLAEGAPLRRGDVLGFVGSTGNASEHAPHLHFTIFELGEDKRWWKGRAVNPYPLLKSD